MGSRIWCNGKNIVAADYGDGDRTVIVSGEIIGGVITITETADITKTPNRKKVECVAAAGSPNLKGRT